MIKYKFIRLLCIIIVLWVTSYFIFQAYNLISVRNEHFSELDTNEYPEYFNAILKKINIKNLEFKRFAKYKNGEEIIELQSAGMQVNILRIPNFNAENITLKKSHFENKDGVFYDPFSFPLSNTYYSIKGFDRKKNSVNLLLEYNGDYELLEDNGLGKHYSFQSLDFVSLSLDNEKVMDISFLRKVNLELSFNDYKNDFYIGFILN